MNGMEGKKMTEIKTTALIYQLICEKKLRRWLQLLLLLEDKLQMTSLEIAENLAITKRTLISDIKELNHYFNKTIQITSDEQGYHFHLIFPQKYDEKKRELLQHEPLFFFIDGLFQNQQYTIKQWATALEVNATTFQRELKRMGKILTFYKLRLINERGVRLQGKELYIRQFFYEFYYEQALLPLIIQDKRMLYEKKIVDVKLSSSWMINKKRSTGWQMISCQRQQQGNRLESKREQVLKLDGALMEVFGTELESFVNQTEALAFFLFSLEEKLLLTSRLQKRFISLFPLPQLQEKLLLFMPQQYNLQYDELLFIGTWVYLLDQLEWLPSVEPNEMSDIAAYQLRDLFSKRGFDYFCQLIFQYQQRKKQLLSSVSVCWHLKGPLVFQQWIKEAMTNEAKQQGIIFNEDSESLFEQSYFLPKIIITNTTEQLKTKHFILSLKSLPEQQEITTACEKLKQYLARKEKNSDS